VRLYHLGIQKLLGHNLPTRRKKERKNDYLILNSSEKINQQLEIILYDTNPTIIKLKDSTGKKETAKLRGTVRIGLACFPPRGPTQLIPTATDAKISFRFFL
jgi:hypothetical protein